MYHIKDEEFLRAEVPMTKEEVRAVSIAKMKMRDTDICLDIGGGTGSISIEMAMFAKNGHVYTVEQKKDAVNLIKQNMEKFNVKNMTLIHGKAPEVLSGGRTFDKIFIGGSGGNLEEIIEYSFSNLKKDGIIALNLIVPENILKAVENLKKYQFKNIDITQVMIARNRRIRHFNMMMAENPVYIISAQK